MTDATFGIDIVGHNRTDKGAKAAEKRLGQIPKHVGINSARAARDGERAWGKSAKSIVRTFSDVEKAGAKVFGGRSLTGGIAGRLAGLGEAASAAGTGLGQAAAAGGVLETAVTALGAATAATVGILAAAAYGAFKLADGWAKGAASIGRTADTIGVATKKLQEFTAAGERVGVDKNASTSTLGGLSQTLNDARYGRNPQAMEVLRRLGVSMKLNPDGTVDVGAMLPAIADAIARQNSSGRRTSARNLGIGLDALPIFTQGGQALSADMASADRTAPMVSEADVALGKRLQRNHAIVAQKVERETVSRFGRYAAQGASSAEDWAFRNFAGPMREDFRPGARDVKDGGGAIRRAGDRMDAAAAKLSLVSAQIAGSGAGRYSGGQIQRLATRAVPLVEEAMRYGFNQADAIAVAANVMMESGGNHRSRERGGSGRGLIQWTDRARKAEFRRVMGVDVEQASRDQQWRFIKHETQNNEARGWRLAHAAGQDPAAIAAGYARYVERPADKARDSAERAALAREISINLEVRGLPPGAHVRAVGPGTRPSISHAYTPVHGG